MHAPADVVETYLSTLAESLTILGSDETAELVAELRAYVAEATASGRDAGEVLAGFGEPGAFATQLLEERGIVAAGSSVPEAPPALRFGAAAAGAALWPRASSSCWLSWRSYRTRAASTPLLRLRSRQVP